MKKIFCILSLFLVTVLTGCFDIVNESTINEDGSGVYSNTMDMSSLINLLKMMGEGVKELEETNLDTTISLAHFKDSIENISTLEKKIVENAVLKIKLNFSEEEMTMTFSIPYTQHSDMIAVNRILREITTKTITKELESVLPDLGGEEELTMSSGNGNIPNLDEYFDYVYESGKMSKKLNQLKYATISDDPGIKSLKEMSQLGNPMTLKSIFNLPRPAKKAEGIGLKLSDDKKKITIKVTIDDFFDSPEKFEYVIEY